MLLSGCARQVQGPRAAAPPPARPAPAAPIAEAPEIAVAPPAPNPHPPATTSEIPTLPEPTATSQAVAWANGYLENAGWALEDHDAAGVRKNLDLAVATVLDTDPPTDAADARERSEALNQIVARATRIEADLAQLASAEGADTWTPVVLRTFPMDPELDTPMEQEIRAGLGTLPIELNDAVAEYISFFSAGEGRKVLRTGLARSGRYRDMILKTFAEFGLPPELIYMAQIESKFSPNAVSEGRCCVGLWQFSRAAGRENGLDRTDEMDPRHDPELATRAAASVLRSLYAHYGDWYLAMAAYNCGMGCVDRAIFNSGYADFWDLRRLEAIPHQTANYVPQVLAMAIIFRDPEAYGLGDTEMDPPVRYETLELQAPVHIGLIAAALGQPVWALTELNPALLEEVAPEGYLLRIPEGTREEIETAFAVIPPAKRTMWQIHRMYADDRVEDLAEQYDTIESKILSANHGALPPPGEWAAIPVAY